MRQFAVALMLLVASAAFAQPTDAEIQQVPEKIGPMELSHLTFDGEFISRKQWPIYAQYSYAGRLAATLQCWNTNQMGSCSGKREKKTKVATDKACYFLPDHEARTRAGAMIDWFDGQWNCSLQFERPFYTPKGAAEEKTTTTKHAVDVRDAILLNRAGKGTPEHARAIADVRAATKRKR